MSRIFLLPGVFIVGLLASGDHALAAVVYGANLIPATESVSAATTEDATCSGGLGCHQVPFDDISAYAVSYPADENASAGVSLNYTMNGPAPSAEARAQLGSGGTYAFASASVAYTMAVVSNNVFVDIPPGTKVKVAVTGSYGGSSKNAGGAIPVGEVSLSISNGVYNVGEDISDTTTELTSFRYSFNFIVGTPYTITEFAEVELDVGLPDCCLTNHANATALVDPTFTVDPLDPNAASVEIEYSGNLAPSIAEVPEPASIAILGMGFLGLVLARCSDQESHLPETEHLPELVSPTPA